MSFSTCLTSTYQSTWMKRDRHRSPPHRHGAKRQVDASSQDRQIHRRLFPKGRQYGGVEKVGPRTRGRLRLLTMCRLRSVRPKIVQVGQPSSHKQRFFSAGVFLKKTHTHTQQTSTLRSNGFRQHRRTPGSRELFQAWRRIPVSPKSPVTFGFRGNTADDAIASVGHAGQRYS